MARKIDMNKPIFVIEHCVDCRTHQWNTRHDEGKYVQFADSLGSAIKAEIPDATVLFNQVPKEWVDKDIYC